MAALNMAPPGECKSVVFTALPLTDIRKQIIRTTASDNKLLLEQPGSLMNTYLKHQDAVTVFSTVLKAEIGADFRTFSELLDAIITCSCSDTTLCRLGPCNTSSTVYAVQPRLLLDAQFIFETRHVLAQIQSDYRPVSEAWLLSEEIWYIQYRQMGNIPTPFPPRHRRAGLKSGHVTNYPARLQSQMYDI